MVTGYSKRQNDNPSQIRPHHKSINEASRQIKLESTKVQTLGTMCTLVSDAALDGPRVPANVRYLSSESVSQFLAGWKKAALDYTFVVSAVSTTKGSGATAAGHLWWVCVDRVIRMHAQLLWVGSRNVVSNSASFDLERRRFSKIAILVFEHLLY